MEKISVKQGDVVLVPFIFSDQGGVKMRPALVVSNNNFNKSCDDVIICGITSQVKPSQYAVPLRKKDIEKGDLACDSSVRADAIAKTHKDLVVKCIARLRVSVQKKVVQKIIRVLEP